MEDGFDEDIEFGDEISDNDEDDVDNVSSFMYIFNLFLFSKFFSSLFVRAFILAFFPIRKFDFILIIVRCAIALLQI